MKVKKTLIFPFEQRAPYTTSKQSLLRMAASWLETTMQALKESKTRTRQLPLPVSLTRRSMLNLPLRSCHSNRKHNGYARTTRCRPRLKRLRSNGRAGRYQR